MALLLVGIAFLLIPCGIPLGVGIYLWGLRDRSPVGTLASLLTLKPLLTTPLWYFLAASAGQQATLHWGAASISILPGVSITLVLLIAFWADIRAVSLSQVLLLFGIDVLRWSNSFVLALAGSGYHTSLRQQIVETSGIIGCILPTIAALVALGVVQQTALEASKPEGK